VSATPPLQRHRLHKGRRAVPGVDPRVDTLMGMVMALTSEVSILRDRLDTHERLAQTNTPPTSVTVDDFVPDEAAQRERGARRTHMIQKVCRPILAAEAAAEDAAGDDPSGDQEEHPQS
jgi:hypothetical protein